ncbi:MAG: MerR family transcriptional regulator [Oscillospiraceae bacterium]|nr:MerR family transcriptional regulator [Oscillospiraceae bacterium]
MEDTLLKIGELAGIFQISVKALRVYEKYGLLKPVKVDYPSGYRYYSVDQVRTLDTLLSLKNLGFTPAEIRQLLAGGMTDASFMEALVHKQAFWQQRQDKAAYKIKAIADMTLRLEADEPATPLHQLTETERGDLLAMLICLEDVRGQHVLEEAIWL